MKNSIDTVGNRTRDLLTCSAVPQPTAPKRAPIFIVYIHNLQTRPRASWYKLVGHGLGTHALHQHDQCSVLR
jgi:hypothetical protein